MDIQEMITGHWLRGPRVQESASGTSSKQGQKAEGEGQATKEHMPRSGGIGVQISQSHHTRTCS